MNPLGCILLIALIIVAVIFAPVLTIWSINAPWGLNTPVEPRTWWAAFWLMGAIGALCNGSRKES